MIKLEPISQNQFKNEILKDKYSSRWMIWHALNKVKGIGYFNYINENKNCGVVFIIDKEYLVEVGILIHKPYRNKGNGTNLVNQLILKREKPMHFTVSNSNAKSKLFFQNFVESGRLDSYKDGYNTIYKTLS